RLRRLGRARLGVGVERRWNAAGRDLHEPLEKTGEEGERAVVEELVGAVWRLRDDAAAEQQVGGGAEGGSQPRAVGAEPANLLPADLVVELELPAVGGHPDEDAENGAERSGEDREDQPLHSDPVLRVAVEAVD